MLALLGVAFLAGFSGCDLAPLLHRVVFVGEPALRASISIKLDGIHAVEGRFGLTEPSSGRSLNGNHTVESLWFR